jgi:hypothetical protein
MRCDEALPLLYDLVDDEIDRDGAVALAEHVAACPACAARLSEMRDREMLYRRTLAAVEPVRTPRELADAIWSEGSLPVALAADRAPFAFALGSAAAAVLALAGTADLWAPRLSDWAASARSAVTSPAVAVAAEPAGALERLRDFAGELASHWGSVSGLALGTIAAIAFVQIAGSACLLGGRRSASSPERAP